MKIVIALNSVWNLVNFRASLIKALIQAGHEVVAVAPADTYVPALLALGCRYVPIDMDNQGTHPGRDFKLILDFFRLMRRERPQLYLGFTVKPNVYGSLAAHALGIPVINNIAGLGVAFSHGGWLSKVVRVLYRVSLSRSRKVFFQNEEDRRGFIEEGLVKGALSDRLPGSGVNLARFKARTGSSSPANKPERFRFILVARMLWEKGVGHYVEAARIVRRVYPQAEFCLLGFLDVDNPSAISAEQMRQWTRAGVVMYLGISDDVRVQLSQADCMVLPSYYKEGVPRALLEAAAMGKPIITTDSTGCRDAVVDGETGFLVAPRDTETLVQACLKILSLSREERCSMGERGRQKMEQEFDESIVIDKYIRAIAALSP